MDAPGPSALSDSRKQNLLRFFDAGEALFVKYGFKKTTVEDVCRQAGLSKPTFYALFTNKTDLIVRLAVHVSDEMVSEWRRSQTEERSAAEALRSLMEFYCVNFFTSEIYRAITHDAAQMQVESLVYHEMTRHPYFECFLDIIQRGIAAGEFTDVDAEAAVWMIFLALKGMFVYYPMMTGQPGALTNHKLAQTTFDFVLKGLKV